MSHIANIRFDEARAEWLDEIGASSKQIKSDKQGEFVFMNRRKIYFPANLQWGYES